MSAPGGGRVFLDVSQLAAPEPLQRALEALACLAPGEYLLLHHRRYPRLLYERLGLRGFEQTTRRTAEGACEVFIWRQGDALAGELAQAAAALLPCWVEGQ